MFAHWFKRKLRLRHLAQRFVLMKILDLEELLKLSCRVRNISTSLWGEKSVILVFLMCFRYEHAQQEPHVPFPWWLCGTAPAGQASRSSSVSLFLCIYPIWHGRSQNSFLSNALCLVRTEYLENSYDFFFHFMIRLKTHWIISLFILPDLNNEFSNNGLYGGNKL